MESVTIIGGGPAGLTAAIYCARANLEPVVLEGDNPGGQLIQTSEIENFPGFPEPIDGYELIDRMHQQAERLGVRFLNDTATKIEPGFSIALASGKAIATRTIIVATGARARYLGLPSETALIGKGVSGCATCDGAFFRKQAVAVIGGGDTAVGDALYLSRLASSVTIVHRRDELRASKILADRAMKTPNISFAWNSVVEEILGVEQQSVSGMVIRNLKTGELSQLPVTGVFVAIGHSPTTEIFKGLLELDDEGYIRAEHGKTSVPGIFAAGDVADPRYRQAIAAAGTGCVAALEAERYLIANE